MIITENIKNLVTFYLLKYLMSGTSINRFVGVARLAEFLAKEPETIKAVRRIRELLMQEDHPTRILFDRIFERLPREGRIRLFQTLYQSAWVVGGKRRDIWEEECLKAGFKFRPPFILVLSPTTRCNLNCEGCYAGGYAKERNELDFDAVDRILRECKRLGIYAAIILGGEPLLYPHLFPLIEKHSDMLFKIYSNGTLIDQDAANKLADLGDVIVLLSLEGGEKETDERRGEGTYRKVVQASEHLRKAGIISGTSVTVNTHNAEVVSSEEFMDNLINMGSMIHMYFLYMPVGGEPDSSLMPTPEQRDRLRRLVIETRKTKPIFVIDFWGDGPMIEGCIAGGRRYFHINAKGEVEPCIFCHIAVDNIKNTTLFRALNSKLFRGIRRRQPFNENHLRPCPIIDNPWIMREVIEENSDKVIFTHLGAEDTFSGPFTKELDGVAGKFATVAERAWQNEYQT